MKKLLLLFFCGLTSIVFGQVESVDFLMKYNCETNQYDVSIIILEGSATTIPQRAQFNSQLSIVVPTGEAIVLTENYMPLQNNQNYDSSTPLQWSMGTPIKAPEAQAENDFYSFAPKLSPASFYNDLETGDEVKLFSFTAGLSGAYDENVRFFKNGIDPDDSSPGMDGGDFSNGFTLGSPVNIYNGSKEESCSVTDIDEIFLQDLNIYPNPFHNQIAVALSIDVKNVSVLGSDGKIYYQSRDQSKGILNINTVRFPVGIYYIRIDTDHGITMKKVVKF